MYRLMIMIRGGVYGIRFEYSEVKTISRYSAKYASNYLAVWDPNCWASSADQVAAMNRKTIKRPPTQVKYPPTYSAKIRSHLRHSNAWSRTARVTWSPHKRLLGHAMQIE